MSAIERLRMKCASWGRIASSGMNTHDIQHEIALCAHEAIAETDDLRADRDRLAARVAELEARTVTCGAVFDPNGRRHERLPCALSPGHDDVHRDAEGGFWSKPATAEEATDADPCPVHFDTIRRSIQVSGDTWGFSSKASAEAMVDGMEWLTRQVEAMRGGAR